MHTFSINANVTPSPHSSLFLISLITLHKALFKRQFFFFFFTVAEVLTWHYIKIPVFNCFMWITTTCLSWHFLYSIIVALCLLQVYMMGFYDTWGAELTPQNEPKRFILFSNCLSLLYLCRQLLVLSSMCIFG